MEPWKLFLIFLLITLFFQFDNVKETFHAYSPTNFNWDYMENNVPEELHKELLIHPLDEISMWIETHYHKNIKDANNIYINKDLDEIVESFPKEKRLGKWMYRMGHFLSEDDRVRSLKGLLRTNTKLYNIWTVQTDNLRRVATVVTDHKYQIIGLLTDYYLEKQFEQIKKIAELHNNTFIVHKIDLLLKLQETRPFEWRFVINRYNPHMCLSKSAFNDSYAEEHVCGELPPDQQLWTIKDNRIINKKDNSQCLTRDICHNKVTRCSDNPNQIWAFKKDGSFFHKKDEHECEDEGRYIFEKLRY